MKAKGDGLLLVGKSMDFGAPSTVVVMWYLVGWQIWIDRAGIDGNEVKARFAIAPSAETTESRRRDRCLFVAVALCHIADMSSSTLFPTKPMKIVTKVNGKTISSTATACSSTSRR